ncbi:ArsR family transcriptional regulator [Corynebacterium suranareeae]|uniref:ArsR family transcriptional regulator n=1 Tax=Corynebacterium suranareeae TaxID=2506452 RepID=A0A161JNZ3_9CORY|nr:metalloregulator ArsR/SmtB family transcription factor [Corynebacterium suranareeae]BAU95912.1 ArsR family transcriptional regulator [Corynebacterium suranareeae]
MGAVAKTNETQAGDGDTRRKILLILLERAPVIASDIAEQLQLSTVGVRRHLDNLVEDNLAEAVNPRQNPYEPKMRGRPAKTYRLTDKGRSIFGHEYDSLAAAALATLREVGGDQAVRQFARKRIEAIVEGITPADVSDQSIEDTAKSLVEAFSRHGYAATVEANRNGLQLCQHHCPISTVAAEFPELCEAEHQAVSEILGQHTQPLATIADGHGICTTNIPLTPIKHS